MLPLISLSNTLLIGKSADFEFSSVTDSTYMKHVVYLHLEQVGVWSVRTDQIGKIHPVPAPSWSLFVWLLRIVVVWVKFRKLSVMPSLSFNGHPGFPLLFSIIPFLDLHLTLLFQNRSYSTKYAKPPWLLLHRDALTMVSTTLMPC